MISTKKNIYKTIERIGFISFYMAYAIEMLVMFIEKSEIINPYESYIFRVTFLLCLVKIAFTNYSVKEIIAIVVCGLLGVISYKYTGKNTILRVAMFVAASKNINYKKLLRITVYTTIAGIITLMLLAAFNILGWNYIESDFDGDGPQGIIRRYCFGLGHPNSFHCMFYVTILYIMYVFREKMSWKTYGIMFVLNIIIFYFTRSKMGAGMVTITVLAGIYFKYVKHIKKSKLYMYLGMAVPVLCMLATIWIGIWGYLLAYSPVDTIWVKIDMMFTYRLGGGYRFSPANTWTLFSGKNTPLFFDMGYTRLFYWYGIVPTLLYMFILLWQIRYWYKKEQYEAFLIVVSLSAYTLIEAHTISCYIARDIIMILMFGTWPDMFNLVLEKEYGLTKMLIKE